MKPFGLGYPKTDLRTRLVAAVLRGEKTATAGLGASPPAVGERFLLQDYDDEPVGVVEVTEARVVPVREIDERFARDEGEGFLSVDDWRRAHEAFFERPLREDEPVEAVRFRLTDLVVANRYRGPAASGNGGYTSGLVAGLLGGSDVEVTLRVPPPLDTPLRIDGAAVYAPGSAVGKAAGAQGEDPAFGGGAETLVAEAVATTVELELPPPPSHVAEVETDPDHPFPGCYVCGPGRDDGFGLRPAPTGDGRVAALWRPHAPGVEQVWAALDCPGAFAVNPMGTGAPERGISVLGRIAAHVEELPHTSEVLTVVGWPLPGGDGRRSYAGTAVFRGSTPLAWARATWFALRDPLPSRP